MQERRGTDLGSGLTGGGIGGGGGREAEKGGVNPVVGVYKECSGFLQECDASGTGGGGAGGGGAALFRGRGIWFRFAQFGEGGKRIRGLGAL